MRLPTSLWQCFLSVCSLPPLVQDCWEFETVTNLGGREKDKYAILLSSTCWLLLVTVFVCLVFLYSVFWIWNCDKLRQVREGRRTGMPFPCQWNVTEERHNSNLIFNMSPGCFYLYLLKGERRLQDTGVIKVSSHFRGPLVLDIIVHICINKCCLIDLDTIMHMCLDVSKHFSSTTLEKRIK